MTTDGIGGLRERFGRSLRLGIVGGGPDSWIGRMHRGAAEMDGWFRVVAGVLSSDPERSHAAGLALGLDPGRCYGSAAEMFAAERSRTDGIDAVAIMTPNDTHYAYSAAALDAGLDVVCDKPVTRDFAQACDLARRTRERGRLFAIVHGYSAYPMIRYARQLVRDGTLGRVRLTQVEYLQNGLATMIEDGPLTAKQRWLLDPARSGLALVMGAIGCHAQHLASFVAGLPGRARRGRRRHAAARAQGRRSRLRAGRVRRRRARHVHRHASVGGGRERHPPQGSRRARANRVVAPHALLPHRRHAGRARQDDRPRRPLPAAGGPRRGTLAARASGRSARGVRQHLCRDRAGAHRAQPRREHPAVAISAHRGRRAHDGVHRGLPRVAGAGRLGRGREDAGRMRRCERIPHDC
ncbi:MAG: Gfo/Idh/MocA family oxidoreductase [Betaproteobacteria bacterium]|nr:Gfo/Idh/MocA family oxidoreductase [Betaproteobacteria bacterium]